MGSRSDLSGKSTIPPTLQRLTSVQHAEVRKSERHAVIATPSGAWVTHRSFDGRRGRQPRERLRRGHHAAFDSKLSTTGRLPPGFQER